MTVVFHKDQNSKIIYTQRKEAERMIKTGQEHHDSNTESH